MEVVTVQRNQPGPGAVRLAERLRELREGALVPLTQSELGQAFADAGEAVSPAAISSWENPASGRLVPVSRLVAYARLFCTPRSFEGGMRLLPDAELTTDERSVLAELKEELVGLRDIATARQGVSVGAARSIWHFPDGSQITLVFPPAAREATAKCRPQVPKLCALFRPG
jgi:hypothetical protein